MGEIMEMLSRAPSELRLTRYELAILNEYLNERHKKFGR